MLSTSSSKDYFSHLTAEEQKEMQLDVARCTKDIIYSRKYNDDQNEYRYTLNILLPVRSRHVILPRQIARWLPKEKLMEEDEWRCYGVVQSPGWVHYMIHTPEPHILLFKRPLSPNSSNN